MTITIIRSGHTVTMNTINMPGRYVGIGLLHRHAEFELHSDKQAELTPSACFLPGKIDAAQRRIVKYDCVSAQAAERYQARLVAAIRSWSLKRFEAEWPDMPPKQVIYL